jgi:urease accessory protein
MMSKEFAWRIIGASAAALALPALFSVTALAHPGRDAGQGLAGGLLHPFLGFDHLAVLLAVALWAARGERREWLAVPVRFSLMMTLGASLALAGWTLPGMGLAAATTWIGLVGLSVIRSQPLPALGLGLMAVLAFAHGQLHSASLSALPHAAAYAIGLALASGAAAALLTLALRKAGLLRRSPGAPGAAGLR